MSDYNLVQRGIISATVADGAGPKDFTLPTAIKLTSAFVVAHVKGLRCRTFTQRGQLSFTSATVFPFVLNLPTAVDDRCAWSGLTVSEKRTGNFEGVMIRLINGGADLEFDATTLGGADSIDLNWTVIEHKEAFGACVRILDATHVRLEWNGTLAAGETIDACFEVFDIENLGDDIKEILFRNERILGYLGENIVQDTLIYDDAGNMTSYRLRVFDSKVNAEAATVDFVGVLQTGERARVTMTQDINFRKNDRLSLIRVLTDVLVTPGVN